MQKTRILLTRPQGENEALARLLTDYQVIIRPLIELSALEVTPGLKRVAMNLDQYDEILFVSKGAVNYAMPLLEGYWSQWPARLKWFAVGPGTAGQLQPFGVNAAFPAEVGSEGLLNLPDLQEVGKHQVLIARGLGGRGLLAQELGNRGARVEYFETYERKPLTCPDIADLQADAILVATSQEILETALVQLKGRQKELTVVVPSGRIASLAEASGFKRVANAGGTSEQALYDAITACS